jgi:hypothetical protein
MSLQEKFQVTLPPAPDVEDGNEWRSFASARTTGEAGFIHSNNKDAVADVTMKTNFLPPGMEIDNQRRVRIGAMPVSLAGATDVSERPTSPEGMREGFVRYNLDGADDQYTGEHMDHFYGEVVGDGGNPGFVERNNYLDRE